MSRRVTLYTRPDCCLCDEMKATLRAAAAGLAVEVEEIDISGKRELEEAYGHEVPVLLIDGRKAFKLRVTAKELRRRLERSWGSGG
jgi:glutaredoxin